MTVRQCESKLKGGRDVGTLLGTKGGTGKKHAYVYMNPNFSLNTTSRALKWPMGTQGRSVRLTSTGAKHTAFAAVGCTARNDKPTSVRIDSLFLVLF